MSTQLDRETDMLSARVRAKLAETTRALPANLERRFLSRELRAEKSGGQMILSGFAVRYGARSQDLGGFFEKIRAGAFTRSLRANPDVRMLHAHDPSQVLGRVGAGTLTINDSQTGLGFRCVLPSTRADIYESVQRHDTAGMSFGFRCLSEQWGDEWDDEEDNNVRVREVLDADLIEVSTTSFPAYTSSSVAASARALWPGGQPAELRSHLGGVDHELQQLRDRTRRGLADALRDLR